MKERILEIAKEKFVNEGYSKLNVDELAREIGISKRTLYEHFESKRMLFSVLVKEAFEQMMLEGSEIFERITKDGKFNLLEELKNIWELIIRYYVFQEKQFLDDVKRYAPEHLELCKKEDTDKKNYINQIFQLGKDQGYITPNVNVNLFYLMYWNSLLHIIKPEILAELSINTKQALEMMYEILLKGILTDFGRKEYDRIINNQSESN